MIRTAGLAAMLGALLAGAADPAAAQTSDVHCAPAIFTDKVGVLLSMSVSCGVDSGSFSSMPCTMAVVVIIKITKSTQARSSSGVMLMSDTAPCDFFEKRLIFYLIARIS